MLLLRKNALLCVATAVLIGLGAWQISKLPGVWRQRALWIPPESLHVSLIGAPNGSECVLPLHNLTGQDIEVEGISASCRCTDVKPTKLRIPSKGKAEIKLTINAGSIDVTQPLAVMSHVKLGVTAHVRHPREQTFSWIVECNVKRWLRLSESEVSFDESSQILAPDHCFKAKSIRYGSLFPLDALLASEETGDIAVTVKRESETTGVIEIVPDSQLPAGPFQRHVVLQPKTLGGVALPEISFSVRGVCVHDIRLTPPELVLGPSAVGKLRTAVVTLESKSHAAFCVLSATCAQTSLQVTTVAGAEKPTFEIEVTADSSGIKEDIVDFQVESQAGGITKMQLPVRYIGYLPQEQRQ
jgi:hypothetical protein